MDKATDTITGSTGTNTPNVGPDVFVGFGFGQAGPSTTTDGLTTTADTDAREAALKSRALKRAEKRDKNHRLAIDLSKAGDALLESGDYAGACANYLHATILWPSNDQTYLKLTEAYLKCDLYSEATKAATRGLSFNPKSLEQRYLRGVARLQQGLLDAAKADFTTVLAHDPNHAGAKSKLGFVHGQNEGFSEGTEDKDISSTLPGTVAAGVAPVGGEESKSAVQHSDIPPSSLSEIDFDFPKYEDDKLEIASLSDSSEANHYGNGIPCRFYNHTGCVKGQQCEFSHAPDEKSVRDGLGRNVCIYFLLDACKFGVPKCVYSHSRQNLPADGKGWWNDEKQRLKVKSVLEMAEAKSQEFKAKKIEIKQEQKQKLKAARKAKKQTPSEAGEHATGEGQKVEEATTETGDELVAQEQKVVKSKKSKRVAIAKRAGGGQGAAVAPEAAAGNATTATSGASTEGTDMPKPQEGHDGEKKSSGKRAWKKRSTKKQARTDTTQAQDTASAPVTAALSATEGVKSGTHDAVEE